MFRNILWGLLKGLELAGILEFVKDGTDDIWVVLYDNVYYEIQVYPQ